MKNMDNHGFVGTFTVCDLLCYINQIIKENVMHGGFTHIQNYQDKLECANRKKVTIMGICIHVRDTCA